MTIIFLVNLGSWNILADFASNNQNNLLGKFNRYSVYLNSSKILAIILFHYESIVSRIPAATALPITPATLGPIACIRRKLDGSAF